MISNTYAFHYDCDYDYYFTFHFLETKKYCSIGNIAIKIFHIYLEKKEYQGFKNHLNLQKKFFSEILNFKTYSRYVEVVKHLTL